MDIHTYTYAHVTTTGSWLSCCCCCVIYFAAYFAHCNAPQNNDFNQSKKSSKPTQVGLSAPAHIHTYIHTSTHMHTYGIEHLCSIWDGAQRKRIQKVVSPGSKAASVAHNIAKWAWLVSEPVRPSVSVKHYSKGEKVSKCKIRWVFWKASKK